MYFPILLDSETEKPIAVFKNAYNIIREKELITRTKGSETLTFSLPLSDKKRLKIKNEMYIEADGKVYFVRYIDDTKSSSQSCTYECDARWYELNEGVLKRHISDNRYTARQAIDEQLSGTGWTSGTVDISTMHAFSITEKNTVLYNLRYIQSIYGGDLEFDTKNKLVHLYSNMGQRIQKVINYSTNLKEIKRTSDTRDMITRLYGYGKNGLTVESVNNGKTYIEDYSYFQQLGLPSKLIEYELKDERFTIPENLLAYMEQFLETYSQPVLSYECSITVFNQYPEIGDRVFLMDKDFGVAKWVRILKEKVYLDAEYNNTYTLENLQDDYLSQTENSLTDLENEIKASSEALVYQRLISCTIYESTHTVDAMYELGNIVHYAYEENADGGITFKFPDGTECIIRYR